MLSFRIGVIAAGAVLLSATTCGTTTARASNPALRQVGDPTEVHVNSEQGGTWAQVFKLCDRQTGRIVYLAVWEAETRTLQLVVSPDSCEVGR